MRKLYFIAVIPVLGLIAFTGHAQTVAERGQALYELRCLECHKDSLHKRPNPAARDYDEVRGWVVLWNNNIGSHWEQRDIDAVTQYLNARFYLYPCPDGSC